MNLRQAAQQALEALENAGEAVYARGGIAAVGSLNTAAQALRAALAEPQTTHWEGCEAVHPECRKPEQEPDGISWLKRDSGYFTAPTPQHDTHCHLQGICQRSGYSIANTPRRPLTDEEIDRVTDQQWAQNNHKPIYAAHRAYARAIERKHGIGERHE